MSVRSRPIPTIPDHVVLRKIGGGAYGEVWLARGVTGALRAVKVVRREDFEEERAFEREFDGILKFEPISRDHPALVNILHVGRSPDQVSFYYYVMELGDDVRTGRDINPIEYEPRTLRAEHQQATGVPWPTDDCIEVGLRLASALDHLHGVGLAHRDVKPSNIIFVNGKAKLADIGLVAARGQRTFVGTEGFVPPEGPGSAQADVYSLGKVLYEIATGKDRMHFPELPDDLPGSINRKRFLELNRIICEVCEPRVSKRKITTAAALADALRRIQRGKRHRRSGVAVAATALVLLGFTSWTTWLAVRDSPWANRWSPTHQEPQPTTGLLRVFSTPEGADVIDSNGLLVGTTPTPTLTADLNEEISFTLQKPGYRPLQIHSRMPATPSSEPMAVTGQLEVFCPPQPGESWTDHLGMRYHPSANHHVSSDYVTRQAWESFATAVKPPPAPAQFLELTHNGRPTEVALTSAAAADAFCAWLRTTGIKAGFLTEDHELNPLRDTAFEHGDLTAKQHRDDVCPFHVVVRPIVYGSMKLTTEPPGAEVYLNNLLVGSTDSAPLIVPKVKPGAVDMLLVLEGYKPLQRKVLLAEGQVLEQNVTLERNQGVVFGRSWENGIGMRFAPVGPDLMVSIWETRVRDYQLFTKESGYDPPRPPYFPQQPTHPVVNVSRNDATAFCSWLTDRERAAERISQSHIYRLPTDLEWSQMAGLQEEEGVSPGTRDGRKLRVFPWGPHWPDNQQVGNFADVSAASVPGVSSTRTIAGYDDGFPFTAPVGSFPPNALGLFDLSGNVQEWVEDEYSKLSSNTLGVLRGGGWNTYQIENLVTGSRNAVPPMYQDTIYGFRVVLAKIPPKP